MLTVDPTKRIEWNTLLNYPLFDKSPILSQPSVNILNIKLNDDKWRNRYE